jgi:hypothetical protein
MAESVQPPPPPSRPVYPIRGERPADPEPEPAPPSPASEAPASPVTARTQSLVAVVFIAVWLALEVWDFLANGTTPVLPLWWHAIGLIVLGYILGMNVPTVLGGLLKR